MTDQSGGGGMRVMAALMNAASRRVSSMFPGYFEEAKHNHYADYGWPTTITFREFHDMYCRNSIAAAAVKKTARKVWQDTPFLAEKEDEHKETTIEKAIRQHFADIRLWQRLAEADRRSMVGRYAGVILRLADSKRFHEPVERVGGGIEALVEIIPAWEGQLLVSSWDDDEASETYGQPTMFQFNESSVGGDTSGRARSFEVHPDRVIVWSVDGTVHGRSLLEPGYNDLLTLEKITGAGGEGFWKNAKGAPVLQVDPEAKLADMARAMGVSEADLVEAMNDQVDDWQKGFDKLLMLQGIEAKTLGVTLPVPEHFRAGALENFAASVEIPVKILVGMQTGERASTEDANEWAETCMGRRADYVIPNIMALINRLERFGMIPERDWYLAWADLTESSVTEKIDRVAKMADVNQKMQRSGEIVFTGDELREVVEYKSLRDAERYTSDILYEEGDPETDPTQTDQGGATQ